MVVLSLTHYLFVTSKTYEYNNFQSNVSTITIKEAGVLLNVKADTVVEFYKKRNLYDS